MSSTYGSIPELEQLKSGGPIIRIPEGQDVPFTPRTRAIVDSPEFQRLAQITQLGLASRVYPGATHTRFEHALGVFHNALRYVHQLSNDPRFVAVISPHQVEVLLAASLLHDLGHWPYCHPIEDMDLPDLSPHEAFATEFLSGDSELGRVLIDQWNVDPSEVLELLAGHSSEPHWKLLRSILSGPIDIDKMDYLQRDSLHCGVPYGRHFDAQRLIQSLVVNQAGDGLALTSKGKTAAELMVFARYVMFSEVYWHHAVRSATCMFARAFYELRGQFAWRELFRLNEYDFIQQLRTAAKGRPAQLLLDGIFGAKRQLYKRVQEISGTHSAEAYQQLAGRPFSDLVAIGEKLAQRLSQQHGLDVGPVDLLLDGPPAHREVQIRIEIYNPKRNESRLLAEASPVIKALATEQFDDHVKRVRLFARRELAARLISAKIDLTSLIAEVAATVPRQETT